MEENKTTELVEEVKAEVPEMTEEERALQEWNDLGKDILAQEKSSGKVGNTIIVAGCLATGAAIAYGITKGYKWITGKIDQKKDQREKLKEILNEEAAEVVEIQSEENNGESVEKFEKKK